MRTARFILALCLLAGRAVNKLAVELPADGPRLSDGCVRIASSNIERCHLISGPREFLLGTPGEEREKTS
jgi:hypothetical protein